METTCIRHTELPNASRLFADLVYHFDRVQDFYRHAPYDDASFAQSAEAIDFPADRRAQLVRALAAQNPGAASLELLDEEGTVAVVTGQQVGLFSGPAYTIFKALAAVRLAEHLSGRGIKAVPIFWLATEDHDLDEINQAWVFDKLRQPIGLSTGAQNPLDGPVGPIGISEPPIDRLEAALEGMPHADYVLDLVRRTHTAGVNFGQGFRGLLAELLAPYGVLFLDPLHPQIRELGSPLLRDAVDQSADLVAALVERGRELEMRGYHAQVHVEPDASLLFLLEQGKRIPLKRKGGNFAGSTFTFTAEELRDKATQLSPNALLRPVMQDFMLPTVAYVGGPAELAYFAQSSVLYERLLGRMPVILHRASFSLIDARLRKILSRYDMHSTEALTDEFTLHERVARCLVPRDLHSQFDALREKVALETSGLQSELRLFDPSLDKALSKGAAKIVYQIDKMRRKVARETLRRNELAQTHAAYIHNTLYPHRHMQERFFTILPFLATHGPDLIERIFEQVKVNCPDHQVMHLS